MPELASNETLRKLDQRHAEILQALDSLCQDIEAALTKISPPRDGAAGAETQQAA